MKSIWKWILGIIVVLVVVAALVAAGFFWQKNAGFRFIARSEPFEQSWRGPMMRGQDDWSGGPMMGRGFDRFHAPMMGGRAYLPFMPFGGGFFLFGGLIRLIPLALVVLVIIAAYQMGRRAGIDSVSAVNMGGAPVGTKNERPARPARKKTS